MENQQDKHLPVGRNIKIGFFHLGSGMADVMTTGVWNRIMISDLGFAATPIGLLISLRYFLAPLGVWAGRMSDQRTVGGYRRLFWIWLGRGLMMASVFLLGFLTTELARGAEANVAMWLGLAGALFIFSLGNALSGSTFLALIYDRAGPKERGRAVGIVWTFLLLGFTVGGILFGVLLPSQESAELLAFTGGATDSFIHYAALLETGALSFSPDILLNLFLVAGLVMGSLWFFALLGEEKRARAEMVPAGEAADAPKSSVWKDLRLVWESRAMRFFAIYLGLSMLFAFSQDLILEPFAADVFDMSARVTTKFAAYWGSMSILGTIVFLWLSRRYKGLTNSLMSYVGVAILFGTFLLFAASAVFEIRSLVTPGLITLGIGLGIWNVGTLGLMMDMSPLQRAGTFLGFWTLLVTLSRGFGVSSGGVMRDLMLQITGTPTLSYGIAFFVGALGLAAALWALRQSDLATKSQDKIGQTVEAEVVFAGAMD